jgi:hypothetical protein
MQKVRRAHIICSGQHHDFDFVRLRLLTLLAAYETVRTTCSSTYAPMDEIQAADLLITYTNNVVPTAGQLPALKAFLAKGGRWLAMHGTSAIVRFTDGPPQDLKIVTLPGLVDTPNLAPEFMALIGGRFIAHLPYGEFSVTPVRPDDPLVRGLGAFKVVDEPYLMEMSGEVEMLLEARYTGSSESYVARDWHQDLPRPIMWRRRHGPGEIVFLALGHRCGRYDLQDLSPEIPYGMEGPWDDPTFQELLRRCTAWGAGFDSAMAARR